MMVEYDYYKLVELAKVLADGFATGENDYYTIVALVDNVHGQGVDETVDLWLKEETKV